MAVCRSSVNSSASAGWLQQRVSSDGCERPYMCQTDASDGVLQTELKRQRVCRHVILATNDKALRSAGSQMTTIHTVPMHVRPSCTLLTIVPAHA